MKGVTDIFISKEKLATFWYLASLGCLVFTGWHLHNLAVERRGSMLYVPIESSPFYIDRSMSTESRNDLLDYHTRLALETFLNRSPSGLLAPARIPSLFIGKGLDQVHLDERDLSFDFKNQQTHQLMEVGKVTLEIDEDLSALSIAQGQIIRVSIDPTTKESVVQSFRVQAVMKWQRNPNARDARRFAWMCNDVNYLLTEIRADPEKEAKN